MLGSGIETVSYLEDLESEFDYLGITDHNGEKESDPIIPSGDNASRGEVEKGKGEGEGAGAGAGEGEGKGKSKGEGKREEEEETEEPSVRREFQYRRNELEFEGIEPKGR